MPNMNKHIDACIYALYVNEGEYCYIGSTSKNAQNRLWEHIYRARKGHLAPVYEWMREVNPQNVRFEILLRVADSKERAIQEANLIAKCIQDGHPLRNQISRDGVVGSMSETSRQLLSAAQKGKSTWIAGKKGLEAGWSDERKLLQSVRMKERRRT